MAGVRGHRAGERFSVTVAHGLPVVSPALALAQSAAVLPFRELLVAADFLILGRARSGAELCIEELREWCDRYRGRGARKLRLASELARVGAESRMETLTRLEVARAGLAGCFELQVDLYDDQGVWIGRFDLVDRVRKVIVEYDGEQHRTDRQQYLKDQRRLDRVRAAGYVVIRITYEDLLWQPHLFVQRVAEALGLPARRASAELERYLAEGSR